LHSEIFVENIYLLFVDNLDQLFRNKVNMCYLFIFVIACRRWLA